MPCDQIRLVSVEFQVKHYDLLKAALQADGWSIRDYNGGRLYATKGRDTVEIAEGTARVREGREELVGEIKQAYSKHCVKVAAKRAGYTLSTSRTERNVQMIGRR